MSEYVRALEMPSAELARFVADATGPLSQALLEGVSAVIHEQLKAGIDGANGQVPLALHAVLSRDGAVQEASLLGHGKRLPAPYAANINAAAATTGGAGGLEAAIVFATLATSEVVATPMSRFMLGVGYGLEVAARVTRALGPAHQQRGYDLAGTAGRLGAAAGSAVAAGLSADQVRSCFGYAATTAAGLSASPTSATHALISGLAASDGVDAALLAMSGLIGPPAPLEGRRGLLALETSSADVSALTSDLGAVWFVQSTMVPGKETDSRIVDLSMIEEFLDGVTPRHQRTDQGEKDA